MNLQGTHLRTNGYSLVEMLISMKLGLILLSGALQIFVRASVTHAEMAARQRMLEGARLAISFLGDELMMAGYLGCFGALGGRQINNNLGLVCRVGNLQGLHLRTRFPQRLL